MKKTSNKIRLTPLKKTIVFSCLGLILCLVFIVSVIFFVSQDWHEATDNNPEVIENTSQSRQLDFNKVTIEFNGIGKASDQFWGATIYKLSGSAKTVLSQAISGLSFYYDSATDTFYYVANKDLISFSVLSDKEIEATLKENTAITGNTISKTICSKPSTNLLSCHVTATNVAAIDPTPSEFIQNNCYYHLATNTNIVVKYIQTEPAAYDSCQFLSDQGLTSINLVSE